MSPPSSPFLIVRLECGDLVISVGSEDFVMVLRDAVLYQVSEGGVVRALVEGGHIFATVTVLVCGKNIFYYHPYSLTTPLPLTVQDS